MKELEYIRYEATDDNDIKTIAYDGKEEFELTGNFTTSLTHFTLNYKGNDYKFKEIKNPELFWDYMFENGDDESYESEVKVSNNNSTGFFITLMIIGIALSLFFA